MAVAYRQVVGRALGSRQEIADLLAQPTWSVSELFHKDPSAAETSEKPSMETLTKLIRQSAFSAVNRDLKAKEKLLHELETQLQFVEHLASVDTTNVQPLVRLSSEPQVIDFEDVAAAVEGQDTCAETAGNGWQPTKLAAISNGDYYVVREGLRKD
jgi:Asp-tRNA(Asn)/Glu-tRNA(Gln) amidotransferase C subunit